MRITAIVNQKGGVGKSSTALALGDGLARRGRRVLLVDLDAQGNLSFALGVFADAPTVYEVLLRQADVRQAILPVGECTFLLPSSHHLSGLDLLLTDIGKEYRLREVLAPLQEDFDEVVLDTPPQLGILSICALVAADAVVIPTQADSFSLQGILKVRETMDTVRSYCNADLTLQGILLTRYQARSVLSREMSEMIEDIAGRMHTHRYEIAIRDAVAVREAQAVQTPLYRYAPQARVTQDYEAFVEEFLRRRESI